MNILSFQFSFFASLIVFTGLSNIFTGFFQIGQVPKQSNIMALVDHKTFNIKIKMFLLWMINLLIPFIQNFNTEYMKISVGFGSKYDYLVDNTHVSITRMAWNNVEGKTEHTFSLKLCLQFERRYSCTFPASIDYYQPSKRTETKMIVDSFKYCKDVVERMDIVYFIGLSVLFHEYLPLSQSS